MNGTMASLNAVHPEELSRRISEIDLTSVRHRADTQTGDRPRYTPEELLQLRPAHEPNGDDQHTIAAGVKTPADVPAPPPPTPNHGPGTPEEKLTGAKLNGNIPQEDQPKKKKKKKSGGKNKKPAPTGFEEFYADPPVTPDEYEEESDLYAPTLSLSDRIQTCIQRYRKRRSLDSVRSNIFTKYLMLGGIEASTTKQFTGLDKETLEDSTAQEIAALQATDFIRSGSKNVKYFDPSEPEHWVVDFEGVAKGFLSWSAPKRLGADTEQEINAYCSVVRNFLNYIITHAVCPEYTNDVLAARKICDLAEKELWEIKQVRHKFPGEFNVAASTLYDGRYRGLNIVNQAWAADDPKYDDDVALDRGLTDSEAERIFKTAIAFEGNEDLFVKAMNGDIHIVKTENRSFEVAQIDRAEMTSVKDYSKVKDHLGVSGSIKPLGRIYFKPWDGPGLDEEDKTDDEDENPASALNPLIETFWLEDHILEHCFIGMKLEIVVHELNIGVRFFDDIRGIYCSFHTVLPNEKVIDNWKEPVPNTRPPPTEDNPDVEENAMGAEMNRELEE